MMRIWWWWWSGRSLLTEEDRPYGTHNGQGQGQGQDGRTETRFPPLHAPSTRTPHTHARATNVPAEEALHKGGAGTQTTRSHFRT